MNLLYYYCIGDGGDYEGITAGDSDDDSSEGGNDEEFARNLAQRQGNHCCTTEFSLSRVALQSHGDTAEVVTCCITGLRCCVSTKLHTSVSYSCPGSHS